MNDIRHRKAIRAAILSGRSLAGDLTKRRGHLPNITPQELDAFTSGVQKLCALLERDKPKTVRGAKDAILTAADPWLAGNALMAILNNEAQRQGIDPYQH